MSHEDDVGLRRTATRIKRHIYWARTQGVGRLIEEDELDPRTRVANAWAKYRWRRVHHQAPGSARAVLLVGLQRSGTNMLVRGIERAPEFEVHNENDKAIFDRFRLRSDAILRSSVLASPHTHVLFKPLCDSHRTAELLDGLDVPTPPVAIWAYRSVDGRVRSSLAKFGDANLQALRSIAAGQGGDLWQAQRLSDDSLELIRSFDYASLSPASASALFWCVRNRLYFEQGLDRRPDVILSSYDQVVADPEQTMRSLCSHLGFPYKDELVAHVEVRANSTREPLDLEPRVRAACDELEQRLAAARPA